MFSHAVAAAVAWPSKLQRKLHPAGTLHCGISGHPESSQGPSDLCMSYSQMLCQLSYSRYIQFGNPGVLQQHHRKRRQEISTTNSKSNSSGRQTQQFQCCLFLLVVAGPVFVVVAVAAFGAVAALCSRGAEGHVLLLVPFGYLLPELITVICNDAYIDTVAILAQGTSWAVTDVQAFC